MPLTCCFFVDLIRHYSNRPDLLDDLGRTVCRLGQLAPEPAQGRRSVSSTGRMGRKWALRDRLGPDDVRGLVEGFRAGMSKRKLARQYGISESSVKRILRLHRTAV
jgi:hypothetical protein